MRRPPALWEFRNIFLPNTGEDQKKSCHLSAVPLALCHMVNPSLVITLRSPKRLEDGLSSQLLKQKPLISPG